MNTLQTPLVSPRSTADDRRRPRLIQINRAPDKAGGRGTAASGLSRTATHLSNKITC